MRRHAMTHPALGAVTWRELQDHVKALRKAAGGRKACWWCLGAVPKGCRTRCEKVECARAIDEISRWGTLRLRVLRDQGRKCAKCGFEQRGGDFEVDHIVAVVEGGTGDRSNLRVLCVPCHKAETKALAARRAEARRK